jgi:hypothetical protein
MIKKMSNILSDGHRHVAEIYRSLAADTNIEEDKSAYMTAAAEQVIMSERSLEIVVPDDVDEEVLSG